MTREEAVVMAEQQRMTSGLRLVEAGSMHVVPRKLDLVLADPVVREAFAALWPELAGVDHG